MTYLGKTVIWSSAIGKIKKMRKGALLCSKLDGASNFVSSLKEMGYVFTGMAALKSCCIEISSKYEFESFSSYL